MTVGWADRRNAMTGITGYTRTDNIGAGMVESADEGIGAVAGAAIGGRRWMGIRRG